MIAADPKSILDIGVGFGKYGVLAREYLELWDGREDYKHFKRHIDGIEAYADYLTPLHTYVYDRVYVGNALDIVPTIKRSYDLVLLIDVLEHFEKPEGKALLKMLLKRHRGIIVSVPKDIGEQGEVFGNVHEEHKAEWKASDLSALADALFIPDVMSVVAYLGKASDIRAMKKRILKGKVRRRLSAYPSLAGLVRRISKRRRVRV
ncbi:MAG: class I SAM-dependent methyltransferase [Patescibacteria group bacterium]